MVMAMKLAIAAAAIASVTPMHNANVAPDATSSCAANQVCMYSDKGFTGQIYHLVGGNQDADLRNNPCSGCKSSTDSGSNNTWNDMVSSIYNRTGESYCFYKDSSFRPVGDPIVVVNANGTRDLKGDPANDQITSVRPC